MTDQKDFAQWVDMAMSHPALSLMRPVVEKELLHYEIFQALDVNGLLKDLVFQGGTALRLCWGADRYSEDLDFAGGIDFSADRLADIKTCIEKHVGDRFGLRVEVKPKAGRPTDRVKVDKWWVTIETAPGHTDLPRQKIKLEIANIPTYSRVLVPLQANYDSVRGLPTVMVNTESLDEIMADKLLAFPHSLMTHKGETVEPTSVKIRHRDIWDLAWLQRRGAKMRPDWVSAKINDYGVVGYGELLDHAITAVPAIVHGGTFVAQMRRFIDAATVSRMLSTPAHLDYLTQAVTDLLSHLRSDLR